MALVSIYIPTKDRGELLLRAVRSILSQTFTDYEIIIVDDGSEVSVENYVRENVSCDTRIRFARNEISKGACYSRNVAVEMATGELVTGLDDDDYFHPKRLERLLAAYKPHYSFVASNFYLINRKGAVSRSSYVARTVRETPLVIRNCIGSQALVKRARMIEVGGYDESLLASQDLDLWLRLVMRFGPARRIAAPLYFVDTSHDLPRITLSANRIKGTYQFIEKHADIIGRKEMRYKLDSFGLEVQMGAMEKAMFAPFRYGCSVGAEVLRSKLKLG